MGELSLKAQIVMKLFELLGANGKDNKVNSYDLVNKLDNTNIPALFPEIPEFDIENAICEMNQKSINTLVASLKRRELVDKTDAISVKIEGKMRNLCHYYLV